LIGIQDQNDAVLRRKINCEYFSFHLNFILLTSVSVVGSSKSLGYIVVLFPCHMYLHD